MFGDNVLTTNLSQALMAFLYWERMAPVNPGNTRQ